MVFALTSAVSAFALENGLTATDMPIVVGNNASATDLYASQRLEYYLEKITEADFSVIKESEYNGEPAFIVGKTDLKALDLSGLDDGGYVLKSEGDCLYICGEGTKGTIYGVYGFLEKYCGCKWYETNVIVTPENPALTVPTDIDYRYNVFFEYTQTDTMSSRDREFSLANGHNGGAYVGHTVEQGGDVGYIESFAHTLTTMFCKSSQYFETNPEYFAYHDGKRTPDQLCLTNPKVLEIVTAEVLALLKVHHKPDVSLQIVSLTQHDNQNYCECDACKAIDKENGSQSGTMLTFVNAVAQAVEQAGYNNIAIDTFAYQYTRKAPSKVVPRDNVIVRLCSIECCFGHTLDDAGCPENVNFMADLKAWSKICDRLYIWDYVNNYRETVCLFPNFRVLQRNVQIFAENNVKGVYEEGNYYIYECDGEFGELRTYMLSKLLQNPYIDLEPEVDGYLKAVYGPGWQSVKEFLSIICDHAVTPKKHLGINQPAKDTLYGMTNQDIKRCDELWATAFAAAQTPEQLAQLERSHLSWRYWKCANCKVEFSRLQFPYVWMSEQAKLRNDMISMGVLRIGESGVRYFSDCDMLYLLREPFKWTVQYDEAIWDFLNPLVVKIYNALGEIYAKLQNIC